MNKLILLLAASDLEMNCLATLTGNDSTTLRNMYPGYNIETLVTGIGSVSTTWALMDLLAHKPAPDIILNFGIAGSYKKNISLGENVLVMSDCFADMGIEEQDGFVSVFDAGLLAPDSFPFVDARLLPDTELLEKLSENLRRVDAITVNTASGTKQTIEKLRSKYNPDIETMEGAAVFYTAAKQGLKAIQLRSVSNIVEPRNRDAWEVDLALKNLAACIDKILKSKIL